MFFKKWFQKKELEDRFYSRNDLSIAYNKGYRKGFRKGRNSWIDKLKPLKKVSKEEFEQEYLERYSLDSLRENQIIVKCDCGGVGCQGWEVSDRFIEEYKKKNGIVI